MSYGGQLQIRLALAGNRVQKIGISSSRPHGLARLLHGKSMSEVLASLPLLYGVCATAQRLAAWRAWQMALGLEIAPEVALAQQQLVDVESLREHLLRLKLGWAGAGSGTWLNKSLGQLGQLQAQAGKGLFADGSAFAEEPIPGDWSLDEAMAPLAQQVTEEVFGRPIQDWWHIQSLEALNAWLQEVKNPVTEHLHGLIEKGEAGLGISNCPWLPRLELLQLHEVFAGPNASRFVAEPRWQGQCHETSALSRQMGHPVLEAVIKAYGAGLLARSLARLLEIAALLLKTTDPTIESINPLPPDSGIGQVETARGRLIHWLRHDKGLVTHYHLLAPTEWNCHPDGPLAQGLMNLGEGPAEVLHHRARLLIEDMDPCIEWRLSDS